jgi:hypothetical protein
MAKLARTLGENVPPELVFHPSSPHAEHKKSSWTDDDSEDHGNTERARRRATLPARARAVSAAPFADYYEDYADTESTRTSFSSSCGSSIAGVPHGSQERLVAVDTSDSATHARPPTKNKTHRAERGWSGEWVAHGVAVQSLGMEEVVRGLRGLKGR